MTKHFTVAILCLLTACATARPQEKELVGQVNVALRDLDLQSEADGKRLLHRIEDAAYEACGGSPMRNRSYGSLPALTTQVYAECRADAVARTVDAIDAPTLRRAYEAGRP
jgi:UrcA family protein